MARASRRRLEEEIRRPRRWHPHPAFNPKDRTGERRGRLTLVRLLGSGVKSGRVYWEAVCDCGERIALRRDNDARSCGCLDWEKLKDPARWKQSCRTVELWGRLVSQREAARMLGLSKRAVSNRIKKGHVLDAVIGGRGGTNGADRAALRRKFRLRKTLYGVKDEGSG